MAQNNPVQLWGNAKNPMWPMQHKSKKGCAKMLKLSIVFATT